MAGQDSEAGRVWRVRVRRLADGGAHGVTRPTCARLRSDAGGSKSVKPGQDENRAKIRPIKLNQGSQRTVNRSQKPGASVGADALVAVEVAAAGPAGRDTAAVHWRVKVSQTQSNRVKPVGVKALNIKGRFSGVGRTSGYIRVYPTFRYKKNYEDEQ
jgi:hypothetical protein